MERKITKARELLPVPKFKATYPFTHVLFLFFCLLSIFDLGYRVDDRVICGIMFYPWWRAGTMHFQLSFKLLTKCDLFKLLTMIEFDKSGSLRLLWESFMISAPFLFYPENKTSSWTPPCTPMMFWWNSCPLAGFINICTKFHALCDSLLDVSIARAWFVWVTLQRLRIAASFVISV